MKEKKLTDEEIVKAMEICANWNSMSNCKDCPIGLDTCCENQNGFAKYALDLIRRLQYGYSSASKASEEWREKYEKERKENAEYEQKLDDGELVSKDWHDEQVGHANEEIERLTEELEIEKHNHKATQWHYDNSYKEGVRLLEENGRICQSYIEVCDINAELQKQVDELNKKLLIIERCEDCMTVGQAVKDTAEKFAEMLKKEYAIFDDEVEICVGCMRNDIDLILKRITESKNE